MTTPRETILVADDEELVLNIVCRGLGERYELLIAHNGTDALRMLETTNVTAVLADQRMPGLTGTEVLVQACELQPRAARLLFTASASLEEVGVAIEHARIHRLVSKPVRLLELQTAVAGAIEQVQLEHEVRRHREEVERLGHLVLRDSMTGLYNHRHFQDALRTEIARARRYEQPVSLLFLDVDHFKNFNERAGHPAADRVLTQIARMIDHKGEPTPELPLRGRATDFVARYGGEEFVLVLPQTDLNGACIKAARIQEAVAAFPFPHREVQPMGCVSVSIGVAAADFPTVPRTAEDLIDAADEALLAAKFGGRNRVYIHAASELPAELSAGALAAMEQRARARG